MADTFNEHAQAAASYLATRADVLPQPDSGADLITLVKIAYQEYTDYGTYARSCSLAADEAIVLRDALIALGL